MRCVTVWITSIRGHHITRFAIGSGLSKIYIGVPRPSDSFCKQQRCRPPSRPFLRKNAAHLLGAAEMKFRIIEDQRETFPVRVLCDVMGVSTAVGAAGPKVRVRRPIVLCSPRSGFSIWPIAGAMAGQESM